LTETLQYGTILLISSALMTVAVSTLNEH